MSSLFHKLLNNALEVLNNNYDIFQIEYFEPVNMFDTFIVLTSVI
jgi:hypothetical protein